MTRARRRLLPRVGLPYHRLVALSLVLAATTPVAVLGALVSDQVGRSLEADASARTDRAIDGARAEVARVSRELDDLVRSYADWRAFADQVRAGSLESIRANVLDLLVDRGSADGGVLTSPAGTVTAGQPQVAAALAAAAGSGLADPRLVTVADGVYMLDDDPVTGGGSEVLGRLLLARKLDARFVTDIENVTGFDVAVIGADGSVAVTTDTTLMGPAIAAASASTGLVRGPDLVARRVPLGTDAAEQLVVASRVSALQSATGTLPVLIWLLFALTGLVAALLAALLATVLRRRRLAETEAYEGAVVRADRLDRLNRLQREFLRSVSHNLRAPLATIELAASDLVELAPSAFVRERADAIRLEERRLARLVNQVLLLSRMETGTLLLDGEPLALAPLVRRVADELGILDRLEVLDRSAGAVAFTDPAATEQITWILLDNAIRYAPDGPIRAEILAGTRDGESELLLAVEDEGPGVPADERRQIFGRFVRGSAGASTEGTGLGLSVARGLARALGGDVTCRAGAIGARFEVRLPGGGPADAEGEGDAGPREAAPA
jgi:signal transduction histidine kinase